MGPKKPSRRSLGPRYCCFQGFSDSFSVNYAVTSEATGRISIRWW